MRRQTTQDPHMLGSLEQLVQSAGGGATGKVPQHEGNHLHEPAARRKGGDNKYSPACMWKGGGHEGACSVQWAPRLPGKPPNQAAPHLVRLRVHAVERKAAGMWVAMNSSSWSGGESLAEVGRGRGATGFNPLNLRAFPTPDKGDKRVVPFVPPRLRFAPPAGSAAGTGHAWVMVMQAEVPCAGLHARNEMSPRPCMGFGTARWGASPTPSSVQKKHL